MYHTDVAPQVGLSTAHISAKRSLSVAFGGTLVSLRGSVPADRPRGGGKRAKISRFSAASRRRMMRSIAEIDQRYIHEMPLFVTLTYPSKWPDDYRRWKRDLDVFLEALHYKYPNSFAYWRMEAQKRGAPHFHLLIYNQSFIPHEWVSQTWYRIVDSGDLRHLRAGTETARCRNQSQVRAYVSKYVAKVPDGDHILENCGRYWGISNRQQRPVHIYTISLQPTHFQKIRRLLRRFARSLGYRIPVRDHAAGATVFMSWRTGKRLTEQEYQPPIRALS